MADRARWRAVGDGRAVPADHRFLPVLWGLLATSIVFGVVAMHSLGGGQHSAHGGGGASSSALSQHSVPHGADGTDSGSSVTGVPSAAGVTVDDQVAQIVCSGGGCGAISGVTVCMALLLSLLLLAHPHLGILWTAPHDRLRSSPRPVRYLPVLPRPSPALLGISRT